MDNPKTMPPASAIEVAETQKKSKWGDYRVHDKLQGEKSHTVHTQYRVSQNFYPLRCTTYAV